MGKNSKIQWTHHTFNIVWGCVKVAPECANCYADTFANRLGMKLWGPDSERRVFGDKHWNEPIRWNREAEKAGERHRVFCSSMADVFEDHPALPKERERLWDVIRCTPSLDWLLLTKRPENIPAMLPREWVESPRENVWLGTSAGTQKTWDRNVALLLKCKAKVRFVSMEPLLESVRITNDMRPDWLIVGGESGNGARPCDFKWIEKAVCNAAAFGIPCFVKQLGENYTGLPNMRAITAKKGDDMDEWPLHIQTREVPK